MCWGPPAKPPPWSTFLLVISVCSGREKARFPDGRLKGFSVNGAVGKKKKKKVGVERRGTLFALIPGSLAVLTQSGRLC